MHPNLPNQSHSLPLMYRDLAPWFHLLTSPVDYVEEAAFTHQLIQENAIGPASTLLELGSGGGNTASHLKAHYRATLTDLSPDMIKTSQSINPELEHIAGDMRTLRLGRIFDAVLIHDAIVYMTTEDDLKQALTTAYAHLRLGGVAVFEPDHITETYKPSTECGGHDSLDGWGLRYLEWSFDPDPSDTWYLSDFAYLLRDPENNFRSFSERHVLGLFPRATWLALMTEVGFTSVKSVLDSYERELFVGVKSMGTEPQ